MKKNVSIATITTRTAAIVVAAIIALICAVSLSATSAFASENVSSKFSDVNANEWYTEYIQWAADEGIITGYGNGYFGVGDTITRADFVTILWRYYEPDAYAAYNEATAKNTSGMSDVKSGTYYTEAINWAVSNGIVTGYGNGTFGPYDNITREQMVTIYYRFLNSRGADVTANSAVLNTFPDSGAVSDFAYDAVCWATTHGVITGAVHDGVAYVDATSAALREQACKIADIATAHDTNNIWHESSEEVYVPNYVTYYQCTCGEKFLTRSEHSQHLKLGLTLSGQECIDNLLEHAGCIVSDIDEGTNHIVASGNTCSVCGRGMTTDNTCYHDYQAVYEDVYITSYKNTWVCGCGAAFDTTGELDVHFRTVNCGYCNNTVQSSDVSYYQNVLTKYICAKCGHEFEVSTPSESYNFE